MGARGESELQAERLQETNVPPSTGAEPEAIPNDHPARLEGVHHKLANEALGGPRGEVPVELADVDPFDADRIHQSRATPNCSQ